MNRLVPPKLVFVKRRSGRMLEIPPPLPPKSPPEDPVPDEPPPNPPPLNKRRGKRLPRLDEPLVPPKLVLVKSSSGKMLEIPPPPPPKSPPEVPVPVPVPVPVLEPPNPPLIINNKSVVVSKPPVVPLVPVDPVFVRSRRGKRLLMEFDWLGIG
uniref:Uncharacterized protein n=1 Tax=Ciona savignyi TaxID=51511 RepID=H2Z4H8_CIOSA